MRRLIVFFAVILICCTSAFAASEQKRALIEELIELTHSDTLGSEFVLQLREIGKLAQAGEYASDLSVPPMSPQMHSMLFQTFDESFSESELREIVAFFRTPAGRKFSDAQLQFAAAGRSVAAEQLTAELQGAIERSKMKRTMADMRSLATASEAYATDANTYPRATDLEHLRALLEPTYIRTMPTTDGWGNPFVYVVSREGQTYRIVSGGPDGKIESGSTVIGTPAKKNDDIIYQNGEFVQQPDLATGK